MLNELMTELRISALKAQQLKDKRIEQDNALAIKCYNVVASVENLGQVSMAEAFCIRAINSTENQEAVLFIKRTMGSSVLFRRAGRLYFGEDYNVYGGKPNKQTAHYAQVLTEAGCSEGPIPTRVWSAGPNKQPVRGDMSIELKQPEFKEIGGGCAFLDIGRYRK